MSKKRKNRGKEEYIRLIKSKANNPRCSRENKDNIWRTIRRLNKWDNLTK